MLAVSHVINKDENQGEMASFAIDTQDFPEFSDTNLLDSIDFDDLFVGINDGHELPDLEMDPEILAEFSVVSGGCDQQESETINTSASVEKIEDNLKKNEEENLSGSSFSSFSKGEEESTNLKPMTKDGDKGRNNKPSSQTKNNNNNNQGKRKVKVDWTPELHKKFVQAVEQLGVDKAVPSRILEIMGIDCLTRHNIASHLQKYRSHRKHLLAREAEAASWSQRRKMYGANTAPIGGGGGGGGGGGKREMNLWPAPTIGFPPPMHPHHHHHHHHFRPLHVWGHPIMNQSLMHMWPKPIAHSPSPPPPPQSAPLPLSWAQPRPPHWHHQHVSPNGLTSGTPCFPQALTTMRFPAPLVPGILPNHQAMYKVEPHGMGVPTAQSSPHPLIDFHPTKESIDAAIGDVITKPWLPLPLGLKPPSVDSVMGELQRQGVPKVPPSCA